MHKRSRDKTLPAAGSSLDGEVLTWHFPTSHLIPPWCILPGIRVWSIMHALCARCPTKNISKHMNNGRQKTARGSQAPLRRPLPTSIYSHWPKNTAKQCTDQFSQAKWGWMTKNEEEQGRTMEPNKKTLHESSTLWMRMWLEGCQQSSCKSISFCIQTRDPWLQRREFLKLMLYYGNSIHICPVRVFWRSKCIIETFGRCEKNPGSFPRSEKQIGWRIHVAILASVEKVAKAEEHHKLSFLVWKVFSNTHVLWYPVLPFSSLFVYYRLNLTPVVSKKKVTRE